MTNIVDAEVSTVVESYPVVGKPVTKGVYRLGAKRLLDISLILLALPFVLPICLFIGALIALEGYSPLYFQERIGKDGRRFTMWKFRTMVPDAKLRLAEYLDSNADARIEWARNQKLRNDPRCTRIGRALRRTSMDELPQLANVLMGDMSLVGPRPMMPEQQSLYPGASYYKLRPGITGYWQVSARNESEFVDRARYDDLYDQTMSLATDATLLARTVNAVLRRTGC